MKKREYMTPIVEEIEVEDMELMVGSGVNSDGIGYGGIDTEGDLDPEQKNKHEGKAPVTHHIA